MQISPVIQRIFFICFFCLYYSGIKAGNKNYAELPDSLRLEIRLTSYVLIQAPDVSKYAGFLNGKIPFAIDGRETGSKELEDVLKKIHNQGKIIPVIFGNSGSINLNSSSKIIFISPDEFDIYQLHAEDSLDIARLPSFSVRELLLVEISGNQASSEGLIKLWQARGKMPNFIRAENTDLPKLADLAGGLNKHKKNFGVVSSNDGLLPGVLLKDQPAIKINGYFSFPLLGQFLLKPYKAGYQFSPDVILNAPNNEKSMKIFRGIRLEPGFALSEYFHFDKGVKNLCRPGNNEFIIQDVTFTTDDQQGPVAFFHDGYVDAGIESKSILGSAFSISVWIKPTKLGNNNSILGKGTNFVLKIHDGKLTFTMAGIKDYISKSSPVGIDKWTHVGVVYSALEKKLKFFLNGKMTDQIRLIADYTGSDHSLLIGSNLWEEFFVGYIGDIKIWERELNEQEIKEACLVPPIKNRRSGILMTGIILLLVIITVALFIFRKKKKGKHVDPVSDISWKNEPLQRSGSNEQIICFGNLKIICTGGTDISHKLSPKLKQLFVLILLHSSPGKKGISSKRMSELLWPGMSAANAKNTRGTSIQNLRQALTDCTGLNIAFRDKMWSLETTGNFYCDYYEVEKLLSAIEENEGKRQLLPMIRELLVILRNGKFLPSFDVSWMDTFQDRFSSRIIEVCLGLLDRINERDDVLLLELAGIISIYDELNETALQTKIRILSAQGKHSLAKSTYQNYVKLYSELYNSNYPIDFLDIISKG